MPNSFTNYLLDAKSISKTLEITLVKQCCNLTPACRFWATKVCLWASKIFKLYLFGRMIGQATSSNTNFENYSRCSLIKWYQFLTINTAWAILFLISGPCFCCLLVPFKVTPHHARVSCLIIELKINAIE